MSHSQIALYGYGQVTQEGLHFSSSEAQNYIFDVKPYLKEKKNFKFLSKQDGLALGAAGEAWKHGNLPSDIDPERCGIYLCSGILPFEDGPLTKLQQLSETDGKFDIKKFSADAFHSMNPILTFKCLPSMPVFHISHNLGIHGSYYVTYPGIREWFTAFQMAVDEITKGEIDFALVGAVVDQQNFLVKNHIGRISSELKEKAIDASAFWLIGKKQDHLKPLALLENIKSKYVPFSPFEEKERLLCHDGKFQIYAGAVSPILYTNFSLSQNQTSYIDYLYRESSSDSECSFSWRVL